MTVIQLADVKQDNRLISPVAMLRQLADEIEAGERVICQRAFVVLVDNAPENGTEQFHVGFSMANINCSTAIAAMECVKAELLALMGYGRER